MALFVGNTYSNRQKWEFEYSAGNLAVAAEKKAKWRGERARWWQKQYDVLLEDVKLKGLVVNKTVGQKYSTSNAARGVRIEVNDEFQEKFDECFNKINEHSNAANGYLGWKAVLEANPESRLKLTHEDWLYFFAPETIDNDNTSEDD